jgi:hypothetical protein
MYVSLGLIGALAVSPAYATAAFADISYNSTSIDANLNATSTPDHIVLSWTDDPTTTQTITWRTISTDKKSNLQFRVKGTSDWTTSSDLTPKTLTSSTGDSTVTTGQESIYSITLTGLKPGTTYEYEVVATDANDASATSNINSFKTEGSGNTSSKFIVFGDSQSGDASKPEYTPWHNTITEAYGQNSDANFVVNMGDLVEMGQYYQHWNNWFSAANGVINNIPEMPVQGNHETYQNSSYASSTPQDFINQFSVPQNGPTGFLGQTYSYNYGDIHFVILDSQEDEEAPSDDTFLQKQADWLDKDLQSNKQKWTIVMFHKTPYYNKATRNNPAVKDILTPVIEKHHVDIVFNGHDHGVSRTYAINGSNYYADYSKGTVYYVTGRSGNKYYTDLNTKAWDANFIDCQDSPSYEVVTVKDGKLTIDAYKYNTIDTSSSNAKNILYNTPVKVDSLTIDKDNPSNSTSLTLNSSKDTQLAIAGTVQNGYSAAVSNNKGYIDPSLIAKYYKGTYDASSLTLTLSGKKYTFSATDLLNSDSSKVCVDALYKQGIDVSYNKQLNCILVDITGRITSGMISNFKGISIDSEVTSVHSLSDIAVANGTSVSNLNLPNTVAVDLSNGSTTSAAVTWDNGNPLYDGNVAKTYTFSGTMTLPSGTTNTNNLTASVNVIVQPPVQTQTTSASVTYVHSLSDITVAKGTSVSNLNLPNTVSVDLSNGTTTSAAVTWNNGKPTYDANVAATYAFTGALGLPNRITNTNNMTASVHVIVNQNTTTTVTSGSHHHSSSSDSSNSDSSPTEESTTTTDTNTDNSKTKPGTEVGSGNNKPVSQTPGWQQMNGNWYLLNDNGIKATGWQQVNNNWYLLDDNGVMTTGWQQMNGNWYLLNDNGSMSTGWQQVNGNWYYLNSDGSMASNTVVDGYALGSDGAWI